MKTIALHYWTSSLRKFIFSLAATKGDYDAERLVWRLQGVPPCIG
jgi:hypothetical protein